MAAQPGRHHEMTSIADLNRSNRFSVTSGINSSQRYFSYTLWAKVCLVALIGINFTCIVISGVFSKKFLLNSNIDAAVWAILTGTICCGCMFLFVLHLSGKLEQWYDRSTMQGLKLFSLSVCVVSGVALGVYLVLGFVNRQDFDTSGENFFAAALFSGFCFAANILLYFTSQWYQNIIPAPPRAPASRAIQKLRQQIQSKVV